MTDAHYNQLRWACRRGMRELDLWLSAYHENHYINAPDDEQRHFQQLLEYHDQELFEWLTEKTQPTDLTLLPLIEKIRCASCPAASDKSRL
ncbi:MAG: succinate dehydrogenase assembly factor 2 [Gammaproteobacteria bacterium]